MNCAAQEVVEHGVTRFIVDDEEQALQVIKHLPESESKARPGLI